MSVGRRWTPYSRWFSWVVRIWRRGDWKRLRSAWRRQLARIEAGLQAGEPTGGHPGLVLRPAAAVRVPHQDPAWARRSPSACSSRSTPARCLRSPDSADAAGLARTAPRLPHRRQLGENIVNSLTKGDRVLVAGTIVTDTWNDKDSGDKRTRPAVLVDAIGPSFRWATTRSTKATRSKATPLHPPLRANRAPFTPGEPPTLRVAPRSRSERP